MMLKANVKSDNQRQSQEAKTNCYLKPAWEYNGSIKSDLPLKVIGRRRKKVIETMGTGQLFCIGKVYLKTHNGTIRIR